MKTDNRILIEIRNSFTEDATNKTGLIEIIEKHHSYLEDCVAVLTDAETSNEDKQAYLYQFLHILHMHAKAEEETLYLSLMAAETKDARLEGAVGQDEHNIIYQLASELKDMDFNLAWSEEVEAKAKVLAIIVQTHLEEEEQDMFPLVKKYFTSSELKELANEYLTKCEDYLHYEMLTPGQYSAHPYAPLLR
ncbi:MAG: hemerythrin domain-containing protein [Bdellovibrio sp.]|nr:hemerythrin domain-containing protein [Bdellovibrio sp.]